jgi:signal transduction histidine kinase/DNA-binding response OmpR family regulator
MQSKFRVTSLAEDKQQVLWIGCDGDGLWRLSPTSPEPTPCLSSTGGAIVNSNSIYAIYADEEDRKWVGTLRGGINVIHPHSNAFRHITYSAGGENNLTDNFILSFGEDKNQNLWIGTDGAGLRYWDRKKNLFTSYVHNASDPKSISSNFITGILRDSRNDIWVSTWFGGINKLEKNSGSFKHYTCFNTATNAEENNAWFVYEDKDHKIWASTTNNGTLYLFNPKRDSFEIFDRNIVNVQCVAEDSEGNFWGGNYTSLILIDRIQKKHVVYKLDYTVRFIHEDKNKNFWVGTEGGGLLLFDRRKGTYLRFTTAEGLPGNTVLRTLEDNKNNLWLSTYNGLSKFNTVTRTCRNFSQSDGLQSNQFSFNAGLILKSGEFLFGGIKGFNIFWPDSVYDHRDKPAIFLTGLKIDNHNVEADDAFVKKRTLEKINEVSVPFNQAIFSIDFIDLEYTGADKIRYAYILEGWDKDWNYVNNIRTANYSRLQEGSYNFKIKVTRGDGVWSEETRLLKVIVLPPWYRTWWAYLLYVLSLVSASYLYVLYNKRQERLKYEVRLAHIEKEKEKELTEKKIDFFTHISHEFRTPLTLIINPVRDLLQRTGKSEENFELNHELNIVHRNARRLRSLIDQLLIFRKADVEADKMKFCRINFSNLCNEVFLCFVQQARTNRQEYIFDCDDNELMVYADREKMEITLYNLVSNAIKYTPEGGKIIFSVHQTEHEVEVTITDNGYGIPADAASQLFGKFYQAGNTPVKSGFGIGLYLVKHFVEAHKGEVSFKSDAGEGTSFVVRLKKGNAHLPAQLISNLAEEESVLLEELVDEPKTQDESKVEDLVSDRSTIVVVDDEKQIRQYLLQILSDKYKVMEAMNGIDAMKLVRKHLPDLVISDIQMDGMDGIELCRRIKEDQTVNHIPVLLLTGSLGTETELKSLEGGADGYITKPFDKEILLVRVENIFKSRNELQKYFFNEVTLQKNAQKISPEYKEFLDKCIAIVEKHLDDEDFTIKKLALEIGMSHSNLYKKVKSISGQSITSFIRFLRLRKAAEIMITTDCNVNQVAFQVGIIDIKYFRSQFNKLFGMNPSEYIKKYRRPFNKSYHLSSTAVKNNLKM